MEDNRKLDQVEVGKVVPMGTASLKDIVTGNVPAPTDEEVTETIDKINEHKEEVTEQDSEHTEESNTSEEEIPSEENVQKSSVYIGIVGATTKLQEELKKAKEKDFAKPVIEHLIERCKDSESLASDVCQDHKTWEKCFRYIYEQARKQIKGSGGAVLDDVVYEWAEDYYHKDDKAEEEKKAKEAAEKKKKQEEKKAKEAEYKAKEPKPVVAKEKKEETPKPKKNSKDIDGQLDMFSLLGM